MSTQLLLLRQRDSGRHDHCGISPSSLAVVGPGASPDGAIRFEAHPEEQLERRPPAARDGALPWQTGV